MPGPKPGHAHLFRLAHALSGLEPQLERIDRWGREIADHLGSGGRLLAVGNGGSAAQAQHLTGELVGRYDGERRALSAIALTADTASMTCIVNDYGAEQLFARQVGAHGRDGDFLVALSTSGRSSNVLAAVEAATGAGMRVLAMTGRVPNPLASAAQEAITVSSSSVATIQELHLVVLHLLCEAVDRRFGAVPRTAPS